MSAARQGKRAGASTPLSLSTQLHRLSEMAEADPGFQFRTIVHLINEEMLKESFHRLKRGAAPGIDGMTFGEYEENLERNLRGLHQRMREGRYRAQPLKRVYIEKEDGKKRPLSIPSLEDKIAQRAVVELLNAIYEKDFLACSYGYRPKRRAHQAIDGLRRDIDERWVSYVLEADIRDYFGSVVRENLEEMLQKRIGDRNLLRLIGKWLHVGVLEEGRLLCTKKGIHQGSVISPMLANVYLHEVLDQWVENEVKGKIQGRMSLYRFADDFVICFEHRGDAERVYRALMRRFEAYGLELHSEKTRLMAFGQRAWMQGKKTGTKPETFNFLGFTWICGTTRKGGFRVKIKTMAKRFRRGLKRVQEWCNRHRHNAVEDQWERLCAVLEGHYRYYGRRSNSQKLVSFRWHVERIWRKALSRRSRGGPMPWAKYRQILRKYPLPLARLTEKPRPSYLQPLGEFI